MEGPPPRRDEGRSVSWRVAMASSGALVVLLGVAVIAWPRLLAVAVGLTLVALGAVLVVSAFAARGDDPP